MKIVGATLLLQTYASLKCQSINDTAIVASEFNRHFLSAFSRIADHGVAELNEIGSCASNIAIIEECALSLLLSVDKNKSSVPDAIPIVFLKRYASWETNNIYHLFVFSGRSTNARYEMTSFRLAFFQNSNMGKEKYCTIGEPYDQYVHRASCYCI